MLDNKILKLKLCEIHMHIKNMIISFIQVQCTKVRYKEIVKLYKIYFIFFS